MSYMLERNKKLSRQEVSSTKKENALVMQGGGSLGLLQFIWLLALLS
jgi:hypothetical protein